MVLVSGTGTLLQAMIDSVHNAADPGFRIVAVGADRQHIEGLARAQRANIATFTTKVKDYPDRQAWDQVLTETVVGHQPDLVVTAGFLKLFGPKFLAAFGGRIINSHPALLPSFPGPGAQVIRETLNYGVKITGCTVHLIDEGMDTGPILAQEAIAVRDEDDETSLLERIKTVERRLLVDVVDKVARNGYTMRGRKVSIP